MDGGTVNGITVLPVEVEAHLRHTGVHGYGIIGVCRLVGVARSVVVELAVVERNLVRGEVSIRHGVVLIVRRITDDRTIQRVHTQSTGILIDDNLRHRREKRIYVGIGGFIDCVDQRPLVGHTCIVCRGRNGEFRHQRQSLWQCVDTDACLFGAVDCHDGLGDVLRRDDSL